MYENILLQQLLLGGRRRALRLCLERRRSAAADADATRLTDRHFLPTGLSTGRERIGGGADRRTDGRRLQMDAPVVSGISSTTRRDEGGCMLPGAAVHVDKPR
jgi:hypothetical protein